MSRSLKFFSLLTLACLLLGCGQADNKVPIQGVVYCDAKPLSGASVAFVGNDGGTFSSATTNDKGEFIMRAALGKNKVSVSKANPNVPAPDPNADMSMPTDAEYAKMVKSLPKPFVAEKFADPEKSGIVVDVTAGMSAIDLNVTSK
jgi:hypothetical protein